MARKTTKKTKAVKQKSLRFCVNCRNHHIKVFVSGHKNKCNYKDCECVLCSLTNHVKAVSLEERKFHRHIDRIKKTFESEENKFQAGEASTSSLFNEDQGTTDMLEANRSEATTSFDSRNEKLINDDQINLEERNHVQKEFGVKEEAIEDEDIFADDLSSFEFEAMFDQQEMLHFNAQWEDWMQYLNID